jgi:hypothetical protein
VPRRVGGVYRCPGRPRGHAPYRTQAAEDLLVTERRVTLPNGAVLLVFDRATGRQVDEATQPRTGDPLSASALAYAGSRLFAPLHGVAWSFDEP